MPGVPPWQGTQPLGELQGGELPPPQPIPNQQLNSMQQQQQPPHAMGQQPPHAMGQQQQPAAQNAMMMHQPPGQQHFLQQQPSANMPVRDDIRKQIYNITSIFNVIAGHYQYVVSYMPHHITSCLHVIVSMSVTHNQV
jgi:hypothetical protein